MHVNVFMGKVFSRWYLPYFHMFRKRERARANVVKCKILNVGEGPMSGHRKQRKIDKLKFIKI